MWFEKKPSGMISDIESNKSNQFLFVFHLYFSVFQLLPFIHDMTFSELYLGYFVFGFLIMYSALRSSFYALYKYVFIIIIIIFTAIWLSLWLQTQPGIAKPHESTDDILEGWGL